MDGSIIYRTCQSLTARRRRFPIEPGSHLRSTSSFTRRRESEPSIQSSPLPLGSEQLHDYVLFATNTGLRPDEAMRLQFRDVMVVEDEGSGQTILEIEVRGNAVLDIARARRERCIRLNG